MLKCNDNIKSYKFPLFKIVLCVFVIVTLINRDEFINIKDSLWSVILSAVCVLICILSILCIYLSFGEILLLKERRDNDKIDVENAQKHSFNYSIDIIFSLLEGNDVIEISIISNNQIISVGASSDCSPGSSLFFDKSYYINKSYEISFKELQEKLNKYSVDGEVCVVTIDGMSPTNFKIDEYNTRNSTNNTGDGSMIDPENN